MATRPTHISILLEAAETYKKTSFNANEAASYLGIPTSTLKDRLRQARRIGIFQDKEIYKFVPTDTGSRIQLHMENGYVIIGSDAHFWPNSTTTAWRGLLWATKHFKPEIIIANGDFFDGASISRHAPIMWEKGPTVAEEIEELTLRLEEWSEVAGKAHKIWTFGNHDARFETKLATCAPELAKVKGVHLKDHFPSWDPCWDVFINNDIVVTHRYKGGEYAAKNNTKASGRTYITGHTHRGLVAPYVDLNGIRWGCETGTLADPWGPQFNYQENNPRDHRSGFIKLHIVDGELMPPEFIPSIAPGKIYCEGKIVDV